MDILLYQIKLEREMHGLEKENMVLKENLRVEKENSRKIVANNNDIREAVHKRKKVVPVESDTSESEWKADEGQFWT